MPHKVLTSGKVYKVWIDIEEYDIASGEGVTLDCLIPCTETFRTADEAVEFAEQLHASYTGDSGIRHE